MQPPRLHRDLELPLPLPLPHSHKELELGERRTGHMSLLSMLRLLLLSMQPSTGDVAMGSLTI